MKYKNYVNTVLPAYGPDFRDDCKKNDVRYFSTRQLLKGLSLFRPSLAAEHIWEVVTWEVACGKKTLHLLHGY